MLRPLWLLLASLPILLPAPVRALDETDPLVRFGLSAGVLGSLPVGADVAQAGQADEFEKGLWVQIEPLVLDIGPYVQLSAFFRIGVAGLYNGAVLEDALNYEAPAGGDGDVNGGGEPAEGDGTPMPDASYVLTEPNPKASVLALGARFFPLGHGRVRPFVSLGFGFTTFATRFNVCIPPSQDEGFRPDAESGGACEGRGLTEAAGQRRHNGAMLSPGLGVRFDPTVPAFRERWRLPVLLELTYVKNFWLKLRQDGELFVEGGAERVAPRNMNLDFVALLLTVGFLR